MKRLVLRITKMLVLLLALFGISKTSEAQLAVYDPANYAEAVIQVLHLIESNINEATMIANQVESLENEFHNLANLDFSVIANYRSHLQSLFTTLGSIEGLMQSFAGLEARFEEAYPDFSKSFSPVPGEGVAADAYARMERTRDMIRGSLKTSADVLDKMPASEEEFRKLMQHSQNAEGILQAAQSGNQIAGGIATQLLSLNAQLASYIQAHTAQMMEQNGAQTATKNRMDHVLDDWALPYVPNPVEDNPF